MLLKHSQRECKFQLKIKERTGVAQGRPHDKNVKDKFFLKSDKYLHKCKM